MPRPKTELQKHTLNLRPGDFQKRGELFPDLGPSESIRTLIARFVDNNYKEAKAPKNIDVTL